MRPSKPDLDAAVRRHFDATAQDYAAAYKRATNSGYSFRIRKQRVLELFDRPGGSVLDAGCGPGVVVKELAEDLDCEFWGIDVSEEMIVRATRAYSGLPRVHFAVGSVENLDFSSDVFDAVLSMGVLEYLADPGRAVREMYRVLKPGGTMIVTVPNAQSPFRIWQRLVWRRVLRALVPLDTWIPVSRLVSPVAHREFQFSTHRQLYESLGGTIEDVVYYNFKPLPSPLDYMFRRLQHRMNARLERYGRSKARFLGTGFIVKIRKPS